MTCLKVRYWIMILVVIAAKFTVKCIFEQLKYISKFSETSCISFFWSRPSVLINHLNGNFDNLILKKWPRKQHVNI